MNIDYKPPKHFKELYDFSSAEAFIKSYGYAGLFQKVLNHFFSLDIIKKAVDENDWITVFDSFGNYANWEIWTKDYGWTETTGNVFSVDMLAIFLYLEEIDFMPYIEEKYYINNDSFLRRRG